MLKSLFMKISAFNIEKKRQFAAENKDFSELRSLYDNKYPEIKDLNTSKMWDDIYSYANKLSNQDSMTKDRVRIAYKFLPQDKIIILDVGAGLGWVEELVVKRRHLKLYANDFSPSAVKYLKKNFKGNFSIQTIYKLKYKKNYFDAIFVLEVLEHIPPSKVFNVLKSFRSFLKSDGVLIVSVPMNEGLEEMKTNPNGHVRMYSEELIKAELAIAGFKVVKSKNIFAFNKYYRSKSLIAKIFHTHKPNNIILKAIKE